jgi:hypothetical protein
MLQSARLIKTAIKNGLAADFSNAAEEWIFNPEQSSNPATLTQPDSETSSSFWLKNSLTRDLEKKTT